jgi:Fur family peroxide stress response transcriptional regulator
MSSPDIYIQALQQAGHRITGQRRAICDYLAHTRSHPTAYQIYDEIVRAHPEISRATIYNTLHVLQALGVVVQLNGGTDHARYETDTAPHVNLVCLRCHQITDYHGPWPAQDVDAVLAELTGFQPVAARIEVVGFCQACRERKKSEILALWKARHLAPPEPQDAKSATPTGDNQP